MTFGLTLISPLNWLPSDKATSIARDFSLRFGLRVTSASPKDAASWIFTPSMLVGSRSGNSTFAQNFSKAIALALALSSISTAW